MFGQEDLEKILYKFNQWLEDTKKYQPSIWLEYAKNYNKALVEFLKFGKGFEDIKSYEALCEVAKSLKGYGYEITNPPCSAADFGATIINSSNIAFGAQRPTMPNITRVELAAAKFHQWMEHIKRYNDDSPYFYDHNKALVDFLKKDRGFKYIRSFEELCQVAKMLNISYQYKTTNPPCDEVNYAREVLSAHPYHYGSKIKPHISEDIRIKLVADDFDQWMKENILLNFAESSYANDHNLALIGYIKNDRQDRITSFDQFCKLAVLLQGYDFKIDNPPYNEIEFDIALNDSDYSVENKLPVSGNKRKNQDKYYDSELSEKVSKVSKTIIPQSPPAICLNNFVDGNEFSDDSDYEY
ncbi:MAG: hypothetical protein EP298_01225 [Gammaproteobacteria bacterium]|nr:MAG: hypothetical protein EP298_01225 [Gammaproteobacteria bacterium]UTW41972.1 hypothetical protein KFE69_10735 [bacterium SCSIO 12844]